MKNIKIILKTKEKIDKFWNPITDAIAIDVRNWKVDKEFTIYNFSYNNAVIYKNYIDCEGFLEPWKKINNFEDYKVECLKRMKNKKVKLKLLDEIELKEKVNVSDWLKEDFQNIINSWYLKMINSLDWFEIEENLYLNELKDCEKYLTEFSLETITDIKNSFLFSTIYGTTRMEDINLPEWMARKIFSKKRWAKTIEEKQFQNNKNAFIFANWLRKPLTPPLIKDFHVSCTKWLDDMKSSSNQEEELDYKPWEFRDSIVYIQWKYQSPNFKNNLMVLQTILKNTYKLKGLSKIVYFHLCFYTLHIFNNWNKRTTRVGEYLLFKEEFLNYYTGLIWMWYYFYNDSKTYFRMLSNVLTSYFTETTVKLFVSYYLKSFLEMIKISKKEMNIKYLLKDFTQGDYIEKELFELFYRKEYLYEREIIKHLNKKMINKSEAFNRDSFSLFIEKKLKDKFKFVLNDNNEKIYKSLIYLE